MTFKPASIVAFGIAGIFGILGLYFISIVVSALPFGNLWWLIAAALVFLGGETVIKYGNLNTIVTRGVSFALGGILTIVGLLSLFSGISIGNPISGLMWLMGTIGLDPNSPIAWALTLGITTIVVAYLWGLIRVAWEGSPFWTKLTFGIVTTIVVLMLLGWLGHMGAQSLLGEDLTQQILDGAQTSLQDGARSLVTEDGRLTLEPIWVFDWGIFFGMTFIGIVLVTMVMLVFKGNRLITIPLGIAGLIFFLIVGGYQAYKLEPVRESFEAVGNILPSVEMMRNEARAQRPAEVRVNFPPIAYTSGFFDSRIASMGLHDQLVVRLSDVREAGGVPYVAPPRDYYTCPTLVGHVLPLEAGPAFIWRSTGRTLTVVLSEGAKAHLASYGERVEVKLQQEIRSSPCSGAMQGA